MLLHCCQCLLTLLVYNYAYAVTKHCPQEAGLESTYEAHRSLCLKDLPPAGEESLIIDPSAPAEGVVGRELDAGFDDVLRVGEELAAEGSKWTHTHRLHNAQVFFLLPHKQILQELVGSELKAVGRNFANTSGEKSLVDAPKPSLSVNRFEALPRVLELVVGAHLHSAFDQFDRRNNECDDQTGKQAIFETLQVPKFGLATDGFIQLVATETACANHWCSDEGVVDAAEQLQHSLLTDNLGDDSGHGVLWLDLHVHLDGVEVVARQTSHHS